MMASTDWESMAWPKSIAVAIFVLLILVTVIGNMLVILSVLTTRRLRTVTNCFVMSLAVADLLVGIFVMPPAVALHVIGTWQLGWLLCDIWISFDIMLCTASILSLCAISLDRYLAVTQPLTYSKKWRCKRLALLMILGVWLLAFLITCPPMLGWYEDGRNRHQSSDVVDCRYNQNKGYVIYSSMGSFFIPLAIMLYVYLRIGYVLTSRRQRILHDAKTERTADLEVDGDTFITKPEQYRSSSQKALHSNISSAPNTQPHPLFQCAKCQAKQNDKRKQLKVQPTFYELMEISRLSLIQNTAQRCRHQLRCCSTMSMPTLYYADGESFASTSLNAESQKAITMPRPLASNRIPMRVSTKFKNSKTTKTLTIVMGGLIACWTPFFVFYLLVPFVPQLKTLEILMVFFTWVGWLNCAINPFIYAFNPDFRAAFWRLTCKRIWRRKLSANHLHMFRG
ncbi:TyrRII [Drosophila busckii]|uniref:TyrRII n=1 Tax=Drosophila busckii TaxID=30019 RepID=A0A0M5J1X7_DROBS|nr:tyramine/octopamine receptor [Drosophila busckii]ALC46686.1 TyrRII [Drosophila busckii]